MYTQRCEKKDRYTEVYTCTEREVRINTRSLTQASDAERSVDDTTPQQLQASDKATQNTIDVHTDLGTAQ